jgi:hypothetical protein
MGMLVRDENIAWRSEEMWRAFNTPVQLGPASSARPRDAQILSLPVQSDDILILASDGLSDNLWDYEVLDEVVRFKRSFLKGDGEGGEGLLGRRTLAGMLSEALCSRARRVSERRGRGIEDGVFDMEDEVPFACRARESGKPFRGGKIDGAFIAFMTCTFLMSLQISQYWLPSYHPLLTSSGAHCKNRDLLDEFYPFFLICFWSSTLIALSHLQLYYDLPWQCSRLCFV